MGKVVIKMKIRILGGGWYGCHLALALIKDGHEVRLDETASTLFMGASGNMPGRLHLGFHYPRSQLTRAACQAHVERFMLVYGHLTRGVPFNVYAIARDKSLVDFGNYCQSLENEVEFVKIDDPTEYGLRNVEGALLTGERHTIIRRAREFFAEKLAGVVIYRYDPFSIPLGYHDLTIDCTFCAREAQGVDRYEPCVTALMRGPTNVAVTIMDGPFPSLYPWDPAESLNSLTSALYTPLSKECKTYAEAKDVFARVPEHSIKDRCLSMINQMEEYYPAISTYELVGWKLAVRAMPLSGADARLVDVVKIDDCTLRIRASKLDAIFFAEDVVKEHIRCL